MACSGCCISILFQLIIIYGYPAYKVLKTAKEGKPEKLWVIYFLIIGLLSILEGTLLFPIIFILGKISKKIYTFIKVAFHLWLYYPEYRGALLLDQLFGNYINLIYSKANPIAGKIFSKLGIPNRDEVGERKKAE